MTCFHQRPAVIPLIMSSAPLKTYEYNDDNHQMGKIRIILQKSSNHDDILDIRPTDDEMHTFSVCLTQNSICVRNSLHIAGSEVISYIDRFLEVLDYDRDGCEYVQIDVPGYSSVILKSHEVNHYMDTLHSQINSLFNYWPTEVVGTKRLEPTSTYYRYNVPTPSTNVETEPVEKPTSSKNEMNFSPRITRSMAQRGM